MEMPVPPGSVGHRFSERPGISSVFVSASRDIWRTDSTGRYTMGVMTDAGLLAAIVEHQVDALRELHERHAPPG